MGKKRILEEEEVAPVAEEEHEEEEVVKDKKKKSKSDKKSKKKEVVEEDDVEVKQEVEETEEKSSKKKKKEKKEEAAPVAATTTSTASSKSAKPLPPGYVCNACGMKDDHAIYNCPNKVSKKEGQPAAKKAKTAESDSKPNLTVFLSGLPFDMTKPKLLDLIVDLDDKGTTIQQRDLFIVHFEDNPNRCRGLAYVNCPNKEEFERTLKLNGQKVGRMNITAVESSPEQTKKRDGGNGAGSKKPKGESRCYRCGGTHDPKTCTNPRICYRCKGTDHLSKDCPKKKQ